MINKKKWLYYFSFSLLLSIIIFVFFDANVILFIMLFISFPFAILFGKKQILARKTNDPELKREKNILFIYGILSVVLIIIYTIITLIILNVSG